MGENESEVASLPVWVCLFDSDSDSFTTNCGLKQRDKMENYDSTK